MLEQAGLGWKFLNGLEQARNMPEQANEDDGKDNENDNNNDKDNDNEDDNNDLAGQDDESSEMAL